VVVRVSVAEHAGVQKFLEIWQERAPDGLVMGRDIPSRATAPLLSHTAIWEPVDEGADFRVRLAGDALHCRFDGDIKGRLMSELFPLDNLEDHLAASRRALESGNPELLKSILTCANVQQLSAEIVILPVRSPDCTATWLLSAAFFL
jgi:hypothetical protein